MNIQEIKVSECAAFQDNPFQVRDDEGMELLVQSIKEFGVMTPVVVRPVKEGGYEIVSGHRRIHACRRAGIEEIPALVRDMERDSAVIFMVDSNIQREGLLPSEKAFAYKMKVEALRHQGKRSVQPGQKSSRGAVAENAGESETQVQRYIRLTNLEKPLLSLVDEGRIAFTPAVELSYLNQREQLDLLETIESEDCTPSLSQAIRMRKLSEAGQLDMDGIFHIMSEVKGNQKEYIKLSSDKVGKYLGKLRTPQQKEDFILKALAFYARHLERQRSSRDGRWRGMAKPDRPQAARSPVLLFSGYSPGKRAWKMFFSPLFMRICGGSLNAAAPWTRRARADKLSVKSVQHKEVSRWERKKTAPFMMWRFIADCQKRT